MAPVRRGYCDGPFGQIHYRIARPRAPSGRPPLLCLHQSPKSGRDYENLMGRLGESRIVVAPDTPGYGESDPPPAPPEIEDYADAVLALVDGLRLGGMLGEGKIDLIGYHTGGVIAGAIARRRPDLVRRLVFVSLAAMAADERQARLAAIHRFPQPRADGSSLRDLWNLAETVNDPRLDAEWRQRAVGECLRSGARMAWGFGAVYRRDFLDDLAALRQPALILCPDDDLREATLAHADRLANVQLVEWDGGNGFLDLDAEPIAALVRGFLD